MSNKLASILDRGGREVGRVDFARQNERLSIAVSRNENGPDFLEELRKGSISLLINGVLVVERADGVSFLDQMLKELSGGDLNLVYENDGIEAYHQVKRQLAATQPHSVPFSELRSILDRTSAGTS